MSTFNESRMDSAGREMQSRYDRAYQDLLGQRAPARVFGESEPQYEARLQRPLQVKATSPLAKFDHEQARAAGIADTQRQALFDDVNRQARADAMTGPLRFRDSESRAGHRVREWHGSPSACWAQFKLPTRLWTGINKPGHEQKWA